MSDTATPFVTFTDDGHPARFHHPALPEHPFVLQEGRDRWHTAEHRCGPRPTATRSSRSTTPPG
ncbi:hypothetical protein GCM10022223_51530 [Kineosporia mesophila]|uniref:Uncharacterized protein n=1 Tax=Kineosporia mesophila TaxID=566012 RepID=A0ABP7AA99_9ACTN|nr:hypothetical protein [Kineosporia mesophila]MCD5354660.1 hypothetical protein [Kineosporia mesophila]